MPITEYYQIGKMTLPSSWIAIVFAFISAYFFIRLRYGKKEAELVSDQLILLLLVWKFSVVLTDFQTVRQSLWTILYFNGGTFGFLLGVTVIAIKQIVDWQRKSINRVHDSVLFSTVVVAQSIYQIAMVLLNDGEAFARIMTLLLFSTLLILYMWKGSSLDDFRQWTLLVMAVHFFVAAVQPNGYTSTPFWLAVGMGVYFLFAFMFFGGMENKKEEGN